MKKSNLPDKARLAVLVCSLMAACTTVPNPDEAVRRKAWSQILANSDVTYFGDDTIRVQVSQPLLGRVNDLEKTLLARASGEAVSKDRPYFAITHINYATFGVSDVLMVRDTDEPTTRWIGSYEKLLEARADADFKNSLERPMTYKSAVAVILLLREPPQKHRRTFDASAIYDSLLKDRIKRKNIKPPKKFFLRN